MNNNRVYEVQAHEIQGQQRNCFSYFNQSNFIHKKEKKREGEKKRRGERERGLHTVDIFVSSIC